MFKKPRSIELGIIEITAIIKSLRNFILNYGTNIDTMTKTILEPILLTTVRDAGSNPAGSIEIFLC